jgi:L-histidine Nalpha-methyltransferase
MASISFPTSSTAQFAEDVLEGLSKTPRKLSSRYFYDEEGDRLFRKIMAMPEYYLTDCEAEILQTHKADILAAIGAPAFELIELGAGDGAKTKILLEHFLAAGAEFEYRPIDISRNALDILEKNMSSRFPELKIRGLKGDYFKVLHKLSRQDHLPKVVLFLGANIGNYAAAEAGKFLRDLSAELNPGDLLLAGFDLKKDPRIILDAYNDPAGITAAFNLNLLRRINRELQADFDLDSFRHWETYNPATGETKSFLVSTRKQKVSIGALDKTFHFDAWEAIDVELSLKYSVGEVERLAESSGFELVRHFFDKRNFFVDSLWKARGGFREARGGSERR